MATRLKGKDGTHVPRMGTLLYLLIYISSNMGRSQTFLQVKMGNRVNQTSVVEMAHRKQKLGASGGRAVYAVSPGRPLTIAKFQEVAVVSGLN